MYLGSKFSIQKYSTLIGSFLCSIGCLWQLLDITEDYLSNQTINKRLLSPVTNIPGFTICVNKIYTIKNNLTLNEDLTKLNNLTIENQFKTLFKYQEIISNCKVPIINNSYIDCENIYIIQEYLTLEDECIIFTNETLNKNQIKIDFKRNRPIIVQINKKIVRERLDITMHSENITFDHFNHNFIKLSPHLFSKTILSYALNNIQSLEPPFKTQCTNYSKFNFKTRGNCVRLCLIDRYKNMYNKWPPNILVQKSKLKFGDYKIDMNTQNNKTLRTICEENCNHGIPCYQQMFEPYKISETETLIVNKQTFELNIYSPSYIIDFKYEIKTPKIYFICYLASTTNLWLGISVLTIFNFLINLKIFKSKQNKNPNPNLDYEINSTQKTSNQEKLDELNYDFMSEERY